MLLLRRCRLGLGLILLMTRMTVVLARFSLSLSLISLPSFWMACLSWYHTQLLASELLVDGSVVLDKTL